MEKNNKWIDRVAVKAMQAMLQTTNYRFADHSTVAKYAYDFAEAMWEERFQRFKPNTSKNYEFMKS